MPDSNEKEGGKESDEGCEQPPSEETELKNSGTVTVKFYPKPPPPAEPKKIHPRRPAPIVPDKPRDPQDKDEQ